ncbi:putative hemolysin [Nostoc sp. PCC 7524]|uniref:GNAT family N-acetyltransferase n=1 Tax=Nostoc sp. (strain ATCC 29411 / PCC 7524) TaxID=28072 RepID=UPI00029EE168|nr:GNAT family N-acyltransferase [Nostoc sp. PCC 7524]AFY47245.1 putative hemolysin [Nostoc sp. PCC 7524]
MLQEETKNYILKFASDQEDLKSIFQLRFQIFNLETENEQGKDYLEFDEFDEYCEHLMLIDKQTGQTIGTYRLQTNSMAVKGLGFYSSKIFNLSSLPNNILEQGIEIGRACVLDEYRNTGALFLLFKGFVNYLLHYRKQYLFGCSSIFTKNYSLALPIYHYFQNEQMIHPGFFCHPTNQYQVKSITENTVFDSQIIPPLLKLYLRMGAKICSSPAIDQEFRTIDFLTLLNIDHLDDRYDSMLFNGFFRKQSYFVLPSHAE